MANNKFKVYGQTPALSNVFPTSEDENSDYVKLFSEGIKPDTLAKSQDVMTPLRELTIFSVAFFNWLCEQNLVDINDFEDALVDPSDPEVTEANLEACLLNIKTALTQAINNPINSKEPTIDRNNTTKKGFLKYDGSNWVWDQTTYQVASTVLANITTYFADSTKEGLMYKKLNTNTLKTTNKRFVYFVSETQDANNNYILNLATFDYNE